MKSRETQGKLWSTAPQDWANFVEPTFIPLYRAVLEQLHLDEKTAVLDAGCGSGLFLNMVSSTGAKIYGIDAAPGLMELTKQRLPEGTFMLEDLEELPFNDNSLDIVTGFNSFQYAANKLAALKEARRVVGKGGKIILGLWDEAKFCDASLIYSTIAGYLPPPPADAPGPFALSAEGTIEKMSEQLQLTVIYKERVACPWLFTNLPDLFKAFMCTGPAVRASEILGVEKVKEVIEQSSQPFRLADDIYFMNNYFNFFILKK
ncbi:MAG TPA: class I SAM-dependent methyltransferase [Chitinophagaceae bacterium]|nr:class I SAM-dependent methyltransferase [Chitinophagaceae bacterium]